MSEVSQETVFDYRNKPPYPEALKNKDKSVIILNLHEPLTESSYRYIFGNIENVFAPGVWDDERHSQKEQFERDYKAELQVKEGGASFQRSTLLELPSEMYEVTSEPTQFSWGRLAGWDIAAEDAIAAFNLNGTIPTNAEIIIIPPHKNKLEPYVEAAERLLGKTPHFAFYTEIMYFGETWSLVEYRPGLRNYIGEISGAI